MLKSLSDTLVALQIDVGAHHLDLMFRCGWVVKETGVGRLRAGSLSRLHRSYLCSHPLDPPSVKEVRKLEEEHIVRWISEARARGQLANKGPSGGRSGDGSMIALA